MVLPRLSLGGPWRCEGAACQCRCKSIFVHGDVQTSNIPRPKIEARFASTNDNVKFVPQALNWLPFPIPSSRGPEVDFVQGLKTIAGHGDPTTKEGLAVHVYAANVSMKNRALCCSDGDMLLMPQTGRLDIQTEFGRYATF